jgi:DNA topoisomerase VI subunit A
MTSKAHALKQLGKLTHSFMKELRRGKLLELSVPKISQSDLEGVLDNFNNDEYEPDAANKRSLLSTESSKAYAQLMAIAGLVAEHLYCNFILNQSTISITIYNFIRQI